MEQEKEQAKKKYPEFPVLVVDDDKNFLDSIGYILSSKGINNIEFIQESLNVIHLLEDRKYSCILLDLKMPGITGEELLIKITVDYPEIPVIILTGVNIVEPAVYCMKHGAFDYIVKPSNSEKIINTIQNALDSKGDHNFEEEYKITIYFHKMPPDVFYSNEEKQEEEKDFLKSFFECGTLKIEIEKIKKEIVIYKKEIKLEGKERLIFCYLAYKNYKTMKGGEFPNWRSIPNSYKYRLSASIKKNEEQKPEWKILVVCLYNIDKIKPADQDIRQWKYSLDRILRERGIVDIIDSQKGRGKGYLLKGSVKFRFTK